MSYGLLSCWYEFVTLKFDRLATNFLVCSASVTHVLLVGFVIVVNFSVFMLVIVVNFSVFMLCE